MNNNRQKVNFKRLISEYYLGTLFFLPFLILFMLFTIIPIGISILISFTDYDMLRAWNFVGVENYKNLFIFDEIFMLALKNTLIIGGITGPVGYLASFIFAWVINGLKPQKVFVIAFYAPSLAGGLTIIWDYLFSGDRYGLINNILMNIGILNEPIQWATNSDYIVPINILIIIWSSMGTGFLVFLAGLKNNDAQLLEAGQIDGIKNGWQELWYIILPQMKPQLLFGAINSISASVGIFPTFGGFPSPNYSAHTLAAHLQDHGFLRFEMGYASAITVVIFIVSFVLGKVIVKILGESGKKERRNYRRGQY